VRTAVSLGSPFPGQLRLHVFLVLLLEFSQ
jgi:hypothetical protein